MAQEGSEYVTLVSSDGFVFVIRRSAAYISEPIKRMLDPQSTLSWTWRLHLPS